jgi:dienelactone hydrolase
MVVFAHGSGSGRKSPRNRFVASRLNEAGLGTLLFDLLTEEEERAEQAAGHLRFDIPLLSRRLVKAVRWLAGEPQAARLPVGFFGASTGAAAALTAAADLRTVDAVVSRGGRPDLAGEALERVEAPTLLIVGGFDLTVLQLNREALARLAPQEKQLEIVPGASHLFVEPGTLQQAADMAAKWFHEFLVRARRRTARKA